MSLWYVYSDYVGDLDQIRSLTGYLFAFGNCVISWKATLQAIVALLTTKVEYMTITE